MHEMSVLKTLYYKIIPVLNLHSVEILTCKVYVFICIKMKVSKEKPLVVIVVYTCTVTYRLNNLV